MLYLLLELKLFVIMCLTLFLVEAGYMPMHFGIFTALFGMLTAIALLYYLLLYQSPEYQSKVKMKRLIHITNAFFLLGAFFIIIWCTLKMI